MKIYLFMENLDKNINNCLLFDLDISNHLQTDDNSSYSHISRVVLHTSIK